jgi:hypothetical protein
MRRSESSYALTPSLLIRYFLPEEDAEAETGG